jgi:hypothetical protein
LKLANSEGKNKELKSIKAKKVNEKLEKVHLTGFFCLLSKGEKGRNVLPFSCLNFVIRNNKGEISEKKDIAIFLMLCTRTEYPFYYSYSRKAGGCSQHSRENGLQPE